MILIDCIMQVYAGRLDSFVSWIVYELDCRTPILNVIPIHSNLWKLPVVPVGDAGTISHHLNNFFPCAPGDRQPGPCNGCRM
jgi:hypothetical protein